jgi:putative MATE family efflux protein
MGMNLAKDNINKLYYRFLANAFGSALVASIFGLVDMAMMGNYQGYLGPSALAAVSPIWNLVYSLGLLTGIGSSVIYASKKGDEEETVDPNAYFTLGLLLTIIICVIETVVLNVWLEPLLRFFGASDTTLPLALNYLSVCRYTFPLFTLSNFLAAFLRNDKAPGLATIAVISGGLFNVVFDYVFIFLCNMGMAGAGLATCLGMLLNCLIQLCHFFNKKNTLKLAHMSHYLERSMAIFTYGFSSFFVDAAMGIVTITFNNQIRNLYGGSADTYISIYGVASSLFVFVQCSAYGIGQASQPLVSFNYGARLYKRIIKVLTHALITALAISVISLAVCEAIPETMVKAFMGDDQSVISLAAPLLRPYCSCFVFLPFNIVLTYFYQGILKGKMAFIVSLTRGALLPVLLIFVLPLGMKDMLWWAIPLNEAIVGCVLIPCIIHTRKQLLKKGQEEELKYQN